MLDRVSTGSDSDLVSDRRQYSRRILDSNGWTKSLPLPVLTRSKCDSLNNTGGLRHVTHAQSIQMVQAVKHKIRVNAKIDEAGDFAHPNFYQAID